MVPTVPELFFANSFAFHKKSGHGSLDPRLRETKVDFRARNTQAGVSFQKASGSQIRGKLNSLPEAQPEAGSGV